MKTFFLITMIGTFCVKSFAQEKAWWKERVVYKVYHKSFKDINGDGIGELKSITQKLDYLQQLGIETIWINTFFKSPGYDNGYDVSDYYGINPVYGTMEDLEIMLAALKKKKMRLILDLVLNHTSDEHVWFKEAKTSRNNTFHDYYIWKPGKKDSVPNNCPSILCGSAWDWNESTKEYYLHSFAVKQPDLNWDNPT